MSGYETSPYRVEWMRFEAESPLPELIRTVPHVAFVVDDLDEAVRASLGVASSSLKAVSMVFPERVFPDRLFSVAEANLF